jgi:hypothetical protein
MKRETTWRSWEGLGHMVVSASIKYIGYQNWDKQKVSHEKQRLDFVHSPRDMSKVTICYSSPWKWDQWGSNSGDGKEEEETSKRGRKNVN